MTRKWEGALIGQISTMALNRSKVTRLGGDSREAAGLGESVIRTGKIAEGRPEKEKLLGR